MAEKGGAEDGGDDLDGEAARSDGQSFVGLRGAVRGQGMTRARMRFRVLRSQNAKIGLPVNIVF